MRKLKVVLAALTPQGIETGMPVVTSGLAAATLVLLAGGCGGPAPSGAGNAASSAVADTPPTLYLDQVVQMLESGRNAQLDGYHHRVESCRDAGIATQPVPASDEHLIATSRWRMWRDREHFAYRMETWQALPREGASTPEELCTFKLALTGIHGYVDAQRSIVVDLETGERTDSEGNPDIVLGTGGASDGSSPGAAPAPETVAGQTCNRWQSQRGGTVCVWSGGAQWGFASHTDREFDPNAGMHTSHIVLDANPPPDAIGYELKTTTFVVGAPLDRDAMMP